MEYRLMKGFEDCFESNSEIFSRMIFEKNYTLSAEEPEGLFKKIRRQSKVEKVEKAFKDLFEYQELANQVRAEGGYNFFDITTHKLSNLSLEFSISGNLVIANGDIINLRDGLLRDARKQRKVIVSEKKFETLETKMDIITERTKEKYGLDLSIKKRIIYKI